MNLVTLQVMETMLSFSVFVGILLWAFSARRKAAFDQLAHLPFDDSPAAGGPAAGAPALDQSDTQAEHGHV